MSDRQDGQKADTPGQRIFELARTAVVGQDDVPPVDYLPRHHIGQRLPFFAIPAAAGFLLMVVLLIGSVVWWLPICGGYACPLQCHLLLAYHCPHRITAFTVEYGKDSRERLVIADDHHSLFVDTPIKRGRYLRYSQWYSLDDLGHSLAGATVRGLSAVDGQLAMVPDKNGRRGIQLGNLPNLSWWSIWHNDLTLWDRPTIDTSYFAGATDDAVKAALTDPASGQRLIGGLGVAPYDPVQRHWEQQVLLTTTTEPPPIDDLTSLGSGLVAVLGKQGVTTLRWENGAWQQTSSLDQSPGGGLDGVIPAAGHFTPAAGAQQPGTGDLTYVTEGSGLGRLRLTKGRIDGNDTRIAEGRAANLGRDSLLRAQPTAEEDGAWMLYRPGQKPDQLSVALYRFKQHQMLALPAGNTIAVGAGALIAADPYQPLTAWVGGHGLFAVQAGADKQLEARDASPGSFRVEEVAPARDAIVAVTHPETASAGPVAVQTAQRHAGSAENWSPFIGSRRLDTPIGLNDITAAADGTLSAVASTRGAGYGDSSGDDTLFLGTRKDGILAFDRITRELFRPFADKVIAPGTEDLNAHGAELVQVGSDHSLNFFNGAVWQRVMQTNGTDLDPERIRTALALETDLVLSDGAGIARYSAKAHSWQPLPPLAVTRMVLALDSLWAIGPNDALYRLKLTDPKSWQGVDSEERVIDLHAEPDMLAVIGQRGTAMRIWIMTAGSGDRTVVFESNASAGNPDEWRTFAVQDRQLYVAPHGGAIGRYNGDTHSWSSIPMPEGSAAPRDLAATRGGLWLVDSNGRASFRGPTDNAWTTGAEQVQRLRSDGRNVAILTASGRVEVSTDGGMPLVTLVGDPLSAAPERIVTGSYFKDELIVASDAGVHRYDPKEHGWENAAVTGGPVVEFAHSSDRLYARTRSGAVLLWDGKSIGAWDPVTDPDGTALHADRLVGSNSTYVAAVAHDGGVWGVFGDAPSRAQPILLGTRLRAAGSLTAAAEIGSDLFVGTSGGTVASYGKPSDGPRVWTNDLGDAAETESIRGLLVPPARNDRLIVAGAKSLGMLRRDSPGGPWSKPVPLLRQMAVAQAAVDSRNLYAIDSHPAAAVPFARVALDSAEETPMIGAAFPGVSGAAATRAIGVAPQQPGIIWRADAAGQVASYDMPRHGWEKTSAIANVDRFFAAAGKLWAWSPARGMLASNGSGSWYPDPAAWQQIAATGERLVLLNAAGAVTVRDQNGDHAMTTPPDRPLPLSSPADIRAAGEFAGRFFIATKSGTVLAYQPVDHYWDISSDLSDVAEFAAPADHSGLFARTSNGALWHFNADALRWQPVHLPSNAPVAALAAGDSLVALTGDDQVFVLDGAGNVAASYRPAPLEIAPARSMSLVAATEVAGNLLLVARVNDGPPRLLAYSPANHHWQSLETADAPAYFLKAGQDTWLVETLGTDRLLQLVIPPTGGDDSAVTLASELGPLHEVSSNGETLIGLRDATPDFPPLVQVTPNGLVPLEVANAALPPDRSVVAATGAGEDCVVLLDDNSVEHYTPQRQWVQRLGADDGVSRLIRDPANGQPLLLRTGHRPFQWNADQKSWVEQPEIVEQPPATAPGEPPVPPAERTAHPDAAQSAAASAAGARPDRACQVVSTTPSLIFERPITGAHERLTLRGSRFDMDIVSHAFLVGDQLYIVTPAGMRRFARQQDGWHEVFGQPVGATPPALDPLSFTGEHFAAAADPAGAFRSASGPVQLTMLLPDHTRLTLAPVLTAQGIAFAHDVIRGVAEDRGTVLGATPAGVVRLTRDEAVLRVAGVDGPAQGISHPDLVQIGRSGGHLVVIDRGGAEAEQTAETGRWQDVAAPRPIEPMPPPLTTWRIDRSSTAVRLSRGVSGRFTAVSLSAAGFGFDRVWGVGNGPDGAVRLYTEDGLVTVPVGQPYKDLPGLDPAFAPPTGLKGTAEVLEVPAGGRLDVWARTQTAAWHFDGQQWQSASTRDFQLAAERRQPVLWDDGTVAWSRDDTVAVTLPAGRATLHFKLAAGRFDADQPTAIAADRNGVAALTPAGVVRYGTDFAWQSVTWPRGQPTGTATLSGDADQVALQVDGRWFAWSGQAWSPLGSAGLDRIERAKSFLLDGHTWRVSQQGGAAEIAMRLAEGAPFIPVAIGADGRFTFEIVHDAVAMPDGLWAAAQFGMVQLDPAARDIHALQPTDHPAMRLVPADSGAVAQLGNGSTLIARNGKWQPGGSADAFAAADRRVVEGGPWHWLRLPGGLKVVLDPVASGGLWHGAAPMNVGFANNRFAFDAVRDAAFTDRPWLATAAGLMSRSGPHWAQMEPPVHGTVSDGDGWSGVFAIAAPDTTPVLFARIDGQVRMLTGSEWRPAPPAVIGDGSLLRNQGVRTADYMVGRSGGQIQIRVRLMNDPPGHYVPAIFDPALKRFRHDAPALIARDPLASASRLLVATAGGIVAVDTERKRAVRLYADPASDGIGTDPVQALADLPAQQRTLALLANGQTKRLDATGTKWADATAEDKQLLDAARHVPYDDPKGWRIEVSDNAAPRIFWRGQPAVLVTDQADQGQSGGAARFAHDVAQSAFITADDIVVGTRGGIVRIPLTGDQPNASAFTLRSKDLLLPDELSQGRPPLGIGFLRPDATGTVILARREADRQALRIFGDTVQPISDGNDELAASQVVARDVAWRWTKTSAGSVQMTPSGVFHIPADYEFLDGRTWSFLDTDRSNRQFPHHAMVIFHDDLFVATAGGVARFAVPNAEAQDGAAGAKPALEPLIKAVYGAVREGGMNRAMGIVAELYVTRNRQLMARTQSNDFVVFDPDRDNWYAAPVDAHPDAELWHVADTPLLDWTFDESGRQTIVVRPLQADMPEQAAYPLFVNGRFGFDDVHAALDVGDATWLATSGGICIYGRSGFEPRRFLDRALLDADGTAAGDRRPAGTARELVRDPDRPDAIVLRTDHGMVLEASANADFHPAAAAVSDGLDVFERAYTREVPGAANHQLRLVQYPFGSYRFPRGALRGRIRDSTGAWIELGRTGTQPGLPLFSHQRFAFDDVSDAVLAGGRLLVATPVGVVTHELDWANQRATILSIDATDGKLVPGQVPALHDLTGIVGMPNGDVLAWNADHVFRMASANGNAVWHPAWQQSPLPVQREQVLEEIAAGWQISLRSNDGEEASIVRLAGGNAAGIPLGLGPASEFGDVSHPASDPEWIYVPGARSGLYQIGKARIP